MSVLTSAIDADLFLNPPALVATQVHGSDSGMPRHSLIEAIRTHNPKVSPHFLTDFSDEQLRHYLDHLEWGEKPRLTAGAWEDPERSPAIECVEVD